MGQRVYLKKSSVIDKTPSANGLEFGELAINYASGNGKSFLAAKKYDGTIAKFHEDQYNAATFASKSDLTNVESEIQGLKTSFALSAAVKSLSGTLEDDEYVISQAFTDINNRLNQVEGSVSGLSDEYLTVESASSVFNDINSTINTVSGGAASDYMLKKAYVASGTTAGRWNVDIPHINSYFDGLTIHIRLGASYNGTSNLLNVNGLGNRFVFYRRSSIATSHFAQWAEVTLTYRENATTGYTSTFNYGDDIVSGTTYEAGWVAHYSYFSDSNTSNNYSYYERRYAGNRLTRYQIVGIDKDERLQPLTLVDSGNYDSGTTKPVNTVPIRPERFFYRSTTAIVAANAAETAKVDYTSMYTDYARNTFNGDVSPYSAIYLKGSYDASTNLFTLDNADYSDFYTQVPTNTANIILSDYFATGKYYIFLGATNGTKNCFQLTEHHELFYFDGTNLIKWAKKYTDDSVSTISSDVNTALSKANSAFNYTAAVSATVKNNYYTKTETDTQVGNSSARSVTSAVGYADATFFTKASAGTMYTNISSDITNATNKANSAYNYTAAVSATVKNNYYTKSDTNTQIGNASARSVTSAVGYADATFFTKASAGTMYTNISSDITNATNKANSAFNYTAAVSATVKNGYWTSSTTNTQIANSSARSVTSAVGYANATFFTKASAGTMYTNINSDITTIKSNYALSANVKTLSASVEENEYVVAAALTDINGRLLNLEGTIEDLDGNYLTVESANSIVTNLQSSINTATNKANSAYNYTDAVSATVKNSYWTSSTVKTQIGNASARTFQSAKTYVDANFVTNATYTAYTGTVESDINQLKGMDTTLSGNIIALSANIVTRLSSVYSYKGTKASVANLPTTNNSNGDVWNVEAAYGNIGESGYTPAGTNWAWVVDNESTGTGHWDPLAGTVDLSGYATTAITNDLSSQVSEAVNKANSAFNYTAAVSATVKNNYYTKTDTNTQIANASARSVTSATGYANNTFFTKASAGTMYTNITSDINAVEGNLSTLSSSVISNYATEAKASTYAAAAFANAMDYTDSKISGLSIGNYLTVESATSIVTNLQSSITTATNKANSAYNYTNAVSATVKNNYYTKTDTNTQVGNASARSVTSAVGYADATFFTKASAGTMYTNISSDISTATNKANSAFNYTAAVSATVKNNYYNKTDVDSRVGTASGMSVEYANNTFFTKTSAGTMYTNINSDITTATNKANSAFNYTAAVSATVKNGYWTSSITNTQIANASARSVTSATGYANNTFFTKASAGTMYTNISSDIAAVTGNLATLSSSVISNYATETEASTYAAAALGNAMAYTDSKISGLSIGNYLTVESANSIVTNLNSNINTATNKANSAFNYTAAVSATVKNNYYTKTDVDSKVGSASGMSVTYANNTFFTKVSAGTMYTNLSSDITTATNKANSAFNYTAAVSATVKNNYLTKTETNTQIGNASARSVTSAVGYADATFFTKASATTVFSNINSTINSVSGGAASDYMLKKAYVASGTTAGRWSVSIPHITEYFDGLTIHVRLGASYNGTSNLLNVNGLGNRFVYWRRGSIATSHFPQWAEVTLVYREDAHATGYAATFSYGDDIVSGTSYTAGWVADYAYYTGTDYRTGAIYERRYAGNRLTRYQIIAVDKDERLQPLTLVNSGNYNTGTTKPVNTVAIRPERFFYRNTTGVVAAGGVEVAQIDYTNFEITASRYTFNSDLAAHRAVYLRGSYDASTNLFTLNTGLTSFYTQVPTNTANITLSSYFTTGDYYIFLGATYSSANNFELVDNHELFYFDGTNLIKWAKKYIDTEVTDIDSKFSNYVTTGTTQNISGTKTFTVAPTFNAGFNVITAATHNNSYRTIPFASTATAQTTIMYVKNDANTGLMFNPNTGKLRVAGVVINGKTGTDLLNATGGTSTVDMSAYLTTASATSVFGEFNSEISTIKSSYALSAAVKSLSDIVEEDELVIAAAINDIIENSGSIDVSEDGASKHYLVGMTGEGKMSSDNTHIGSPYFYWENNNLYSASDERLKDFVGDVDVDLDKLSSIPKKYFKWKGDEKGDISIGTSAQKLKAIYPELVSGSEDDSYGVAYDKLSVIALAAIDKLYEENKKLNLEIKELKKRLDKLESK